MNLINMNNPFLLPGRESPACSSSSLASSASVKAFRTALLTAVDAVNVASKSGWLEGDAATYVNILTAQYLASGIQSPYRTYLAMFSM